MKTLLLMLCGVAASFLAPPPADDRFCDVNPERPGPQMSTDQFA